VGIEELVRAAKTVPGILAAVSASRVWHVTLSGCSNRSNECELGVAASLQRFNAEHAGRKVAVLD
jgi:hypothetical protein